MSEGKLLLLYLLLLVVVSVGMGWMRDSLKPSVTSSPSKPKVWSALVCGCSLCLGRNKCVCVQKSLHVVFLS